MRKVISVALRVTILIWFVFGALTLLGANPSLIPYPFYRTLLGFGALCVAIILTYLSVNLWRRSALITYPLIGLNICLFLVTFADDIGWVDILVAIPPLTAAILLCKNRSRYL